MPISSWQQEGQEGGKGGELPAPVDSIIILRNHSVFYWSDCVNTPITQEAKAQRRRSEAKPSDSVGSSKTPNPTLSLGTERGGVEGGILQRQQGSNSAKVTVTFSLIGIGCYFFNSIFPPASVGREDGKDTLPFAPVPEAERDEAKPKPSFPPVV